MKTLLLNILTISILTINSLTNYFSDKDITKETLTALKNEIIQDTSITPETKDTIVKILDESIKNIDSAENFASELENLKKEIFSAQEIINSNTDYISNIDKQSQTLDLKNMQLSKLIQTLANFESEKKQKEEEYEKTLIDVTNRDSYLKELIQKASELKKSINELQLIPLPSFTNNASQPSLIDEANKILHLTKLRNLQSELELVNFKIENYDTNTKIIISRLDRYKAELQYIEDKIKSVKEEIELKKREEIEKTIQKSFEVLNSLPNFNLNLIPELSSLAEENIKLAQERQNFSLIYDKTTQYKNSLSTYQQKLRYQKTQLESLKSKTSTGKLDSAIRLNLKQVKLSLPKISDLKEIKSNIEKDLAEAERKYSELLLKRIELGQTEKIIQSKYQQLTTSLPSIDKKKIKRGIDDIIETHREILSSLISDYEAYILVLTDSLNILNNWIEQTKEFISFIEENLLWIKTPFPNKEEIKSDTLKLIKQLKATFLSPTNYKQLLQSLFFILVSISVITTLSLLYYTFLGTKIITLCPSLRTPLNFNLVNFAKFIFCFTTRTFTIPIGILIIAYLINFSKYLQISQFLIPSLVNSAIAILLFTLLINLIKHKDISLLILNFYSKEFTRIYKKLLILGTIVTTMTFISTISNLIWVETQSLLSDIAFRLTFLLFLPVTIALTLHLSTEIKKISSSDQENLSKALNFSLLRNLLLLIASSLTIVLILQILGYTYASYELYNKILYSILIATVIWISYRFLSITTNYYKWKLNFQHSIKTQSKDKKDSKKEESPITSEEQTETNLEKASLLLTQINEGIYWVSWLTTLLVILYIWSDIFPALGYFQKIVLWETSSITTEVPQSQLTSTAEESKTFPSITSSSQIKEPVTLWDLIIAIIIMAVTLFLFKNIGFYTDYLILKRTNINEGEKYAFTTILEYIVLIVGIIMALGTVKITWNKIQWLVAALGVGLGFGLQEIVANFVSGLILLFERPLSVGDIVTIGDVSGRVKALKMRATSIINWENKELIVPNKEILSQKFINWTRENPIIRLDIPVGVSYNSNINKVIEILNEIATSHPFVEHDPPPKAYFLRFGSSALECELRVYTKISYFLELKHELSCAILNRFNEEGIEISYPQMDVHIKTPLTIQSPCQEHPLIENKNTTPL